MGCNGFWFGYQTLQCLKGIIRVNRAVIFELAVFLLLSLFWINRFTTTTTTINIALNNHFRPTAFPPPQPQPPLNKPRHPHPFTHNRQHLHTTNIASPSSPKRRHLCAGSGEIRSNGIAAGGCGGLLTVQGVRIKRLGDFHNVRSPRRVGGQRSEVRDRRPNRVSPAL